MINSKTIDIGGISISIRELQVRDLIEAPDQVGRVTDEGIPYLVLRCIDKKVEEIADLSFSELEQLEAAFMEVNAAFFRRAGKAQSPTA